MKKVAHLHELEKSLTVCRKILRSPLCALLSFRMASAAPISAMGLNTKIEFRAVFQRKITNIIGNLSQAKKLARNAATPEKKRRHSREETPPLQRRNAATPEKKRRHSREETLPLQRRNAATPENITWITPVYKKEVKFQSFSTEKKSEWCHTIRNWATSLLASWHEIKQVVSRQRLTTSATSIRPCKAAETLSTTTRYNTACAKKNIPAIESESLEVKKREFRSVLQRGFGPLVRWSTFFVTASCSMSVIITWGM